MRFSIKDNANNKIISSAKTIDELSDGYHTFKELYDFRREMFTSTKPGYEGKQLFIPFVGYWLEEDGSFMEAGSYACM